MNTYVENNIKQDETIIDKVKISKACLALPIGAIVVFGVLTIYLFFYSNNNAAQLVITLIGGIPLLISVLGLIPRLLYMKTTELAVTEKRILGRVGAFNVTSIDNPIANLHAIQIKQGITARIFNYGSVVIQTGAGAVFNVNYVKAPYEFKNKSIL